MKGQFSRVGDGLLVRAAGKVNLSLLVAGKREDGYHEIETVMAKIDWFDEIFLERGERDGIELICRGEYQVPEGEDNLVYKAAKMVLEEVKSKKEKAKRNNEGGKQDTAVKITLTKNMPAGSGLGSGSSDAAATISGVNEFLGLGMSKEKMAEAAARVGSDTAFFLDGPVGFCTGRGEKVKKLPNFEFSALLVVPDVSVSTKRVYENYRHNDELYRGLKSRIDGYIEKNRIDLVCKMCANMLQESSFELHKELVELKERIEGLGIGPMCLSGSGCSMFCVINNRNVEGVKAYRDKLERDFGFRSRIVRNNRW